MGDTSTRQTGEAAPGQQSIAGLRREIQELKRQLVDKTAESGRLLNEAQALTHLGSWEWDVASGTISWSDELYRIYGLKPQEREIGFEEFMGMIHDDDRERIQKVIGASVATGEPFVFEHRIVRPSGQQRVLYGMGKVILGADGKPVRMFGTSQDVTERRDVEQAMRRSDERFRTAARATRDLIYEIDLSSGQLWCNDVLEEEYGYSMDGVTASSTWWRDCIHEEDAPRIQEQLVLLLRDGGHTWSAEHRLRKSDGSYAHVRNRAYVLRDDTGRAERIIGSCLDITEAKRLDRAKDDFLSLVSHQLRTPLTVIRLYGNMLTDGMAGQLEKTQHQYASNMTTASIRLIKLVGDILNISRLELERLKIQPVATDINGLISQHLMELEPIAEQRSISMTFVPDTTIEPVPVDVTIFGEILSNLVGNALRYSPPDNGRIKISFNKLKSGYRLKVTDNGIGIPREAQDHIFERFYRADNAGKVDGEGSGLGLYLVKLFTEASGGSISLKSTEGKGSEFNVTFPLTGMRAKTVHS